MDPLGLAAAAVGAGISTGLAVISVTVASLRLVRQAGTVQTPDLGAPFALLVAGTLGGLLLAGITTWWLLGPIGSSYRRGGLAMVGAFATVVLMLATMPLDHYFGPAGPLGLAGGAAVAALVLARRARRLGTVR